jgi:hypothetical protein
VADRVDVRDRGVARVDGRPDRGSKVGEQRGVNRVDLAHRGGHDVVLQAEDGEPVSSGDANAPAAAPPLVCAKAPSYDQRESGEGSERDHLSSFREELDE